MAREERAADGDLGDRAGGRCRLVGQPGRQGADDRPGPSAGRRHAPASRRAAGAPAPVRPGSPGPMARRRVRSGATTSGPEPTRIDVPARLLKRCANAWSARARSGSTPLATISAIASDATGRSARTPRRPRPPAPRAPGTTVASRTYARRSRGGTIGDPPELGQAHADCPSARPRTGRPRSPAAAPSRGLPGRDVLGRRRSAGRPARDRSGPRSG